MSNFSEAIKSDQLVVTAEVTPPCGHDARRIKDLGPILKGKVHAVVAEENIDGVHMGSLVAAVHLKSAGVDAVVTLLTRDTNRIGLQSAVLGAVSLGISDFLVLSGHHQALTAEKQARGVYDVDSVQAIGVFRSMREEGVLTCGQKIEAPVSISIGAAANPFAGPIQLRALRVEKKIKAGADFIMTKPVFDARRFREWLDLLRERGLPGTVCLIAGIMWLRSADEAKKLRETYRGINIPDEIIERLSQAADGEREGLLVAAEMVDQIRTFEGLRGFHLWARGNEESLPEMLESARISIA